MEPDKIERLLQKYWDCATTEAEEAELKRYFQYGQVADHLKPYRSLFAAYADAAQQAMPQPFSLEAIQQAAVPANGQAKGTLTTATQPEADTGQGKQVLLWSVMSRRAAAAVAIIVVGAVLMVSQLGNNPKEPAYAVNDPHEAYLETKKALMLVSAKMNANNASNALQTVSGRLYNNQAGKAIGKVRNKLGMAQNHVYGLGALGKGQRVIEKEIINKNQ